uniref:Putative phosphoribosylamidoimidazole-succinocarboxamide synthase n=1 Tax=Nyssomyia neivai TaxID=330878 RepID=A0A1L8DXY3_9DIPT
MSHSIGGHKLGQLIIEGKTKQVFDLPEKKGYCLIQSKDRITAGDGVKAHDLAGKAAISTQTNGKVFGLLNAAGLTTAYVGPVTETAFIAKKCDMIPIEWVCRRLATGSFLKRCPGVPEGFRFCPPKQETFFKDDANHDPQWCEEQILAAGFKFNGRTIGRNEVDYMRQYTVVVFEILEKAWATRDCALIDMKIEFGVDEDGNILLADVIDSDSWRLWPGSDKRLMKDKQVYRNLSNVTQTDLETVKRNFEWVSKQLDGIIPKNDSLVVVLMGSATDQAHCEKIAKHCLDLGLNVELRVTSAHKSTRGTLDIVAEYEGSLGKLVFIAVAGRSNGLGPVLSGYTTYPVINCPPVKPDNLTVDVWSSLNVPSGLGCTTVIYPEAAALAAAQILGVGNYLLWSKLRVKQLTNISTLQKGDNVVKGVKTA